ncbi:S53 family peptidase [Mucilaginibacter sp.]|uniref:S53 family peptidase n=1 Tax=Mucilaginibacter sp. TaxID=1882438 RepID=UPI0025D82D4B|nr:S53 family peptidase [Mucilaginibacter sp.]
MKTLDKVALAGSYKKAHMGETTAKVNRRQFIDVTVRVRRKKSIEAHLGEGKQIGHADYEKEFGSSQKDVDQVEAFAHQYKLKTVEVSLPRRSVILRGSVANMEAAFGVSLAKAVDSHGDDIRVRKGDIFIPESLSDIIEGVFGLDNRKVARPMFKALDGQGGISPSAKVSNSFTPTRLAQIYGFPTGFNGKGQTIAIIELGGGYRTKDLTAYFKGLGIKKPSVKAISVDGGKNKPSTADSADGEVMLDIEVAGAVATGAKIVVYFCPNTDKGFLDAITKAVHDGTHKPSVVSISWGGAEVAWTAQSLNTYNEAFKGAAALGVTICAAAGDNGSSDGIKGGDVHVDFPASSPYVLACGGTSLKANGNTITSETVWHDSVNSATGGGVSNVFPLPDYQKNANVPKAIGTNNDGRGVPDVAGNADPNTGYVVLVDGQQMVIGGTSAVAPLYAGLIACLNQQSSKWAGFINPKLYANPSLCRDITSGNNRTADGNKGYDAGAGWDACTGLGVFNKL